MSIDELLARVDVKRIRSHGYSHIGLDVIVEPSLEKLPEEVRWTHSIA